MKKLIVELPKNFYRFFYFTFWGFYFSARYFSCKKIINSTLMSI